MRHMNWAFDVKRGLRQVPTQEKLPLGSYLLTGGKWYVRTLARRQARAGRVWEPTYIEQLPGALRVAALLLGLQLR